MIRVAHVITELAVGGAETMLSRLVRGMNGDAFSQIVISLGDVGPVGEVIRKSGVTVKSLGMRPGRPSPGALWELARTLRTFRPHAVQTWLYHADLAGLLASGLSGRPKLLWNLRCSDMDLTRYSPMTRLVVRGCAALSGLPDAVVVNSEAGRRYHAAIGYHPCRWETIPNGFDLDQFRGDPAARARLRSELGLPEDTLLVGLVARFDPMKDHETFLRAAAAVHRRHETVHFVLCGSGVTAGNAALGALIDTLGLRSAVHLLGERHDIPMITAALDIACSSSCWGEGFPNIVGEAMACGVPVVVTDVGDSKLLLGKAGSVVPPGNPDCFADALSELIEAGPARRNMGMLGRRRAEENFSLQTIVGRYEDLYRELSL